VLLGPRVSCVHRKKGCGFVVVGCGLVHLN